MDFTIRLVEHNGHEQVFSASKVWADKGEKPTDTNVYYSDEDNNTHRLANYGIAYVMNAMGQTVAKYHLGYGEDRTAPPAAKKKAA